MRTRVAIVLPYFGAGGGEHMVSRLAAHLDLSKVEAEVICIFGEPQNNELEKKILEHGVPIKYIGKGKGFSGAAIKRLNHELSEFQPDVVHTHLSACVYCAEWVLTHNVKMLHTVHSMPAFELIMPKKVVMAAMYRCGKAIPVAISHEIQALTQSYYHLKTTPELVYNPVDVTRYSKLEKKKRKNFTFVNVGRLHEAKNQILLVKAFEKILEDQSDTDLFILGDGPLKEELETYLKEHKLTQHIFMKGNVENVEQYLAEADAFVLSSNYEGLPLVILEAMASGLPIVSTDVGGVKDVVTDNGLLVEPHSIEKLASAMMQIKANAEMRKDFSERSKRNVMQFDSSIIAQEYIALYEKYARLVKH